MEVILTAQVLRSLNDQHSFLLAPYMLNNAEVMTELGYNIRVVDDGFNDRNTHPREAPFHGETLKHILLKSTADSILSWFNRDWLSILRDHAPGRTHTYILDGTKILIPAHLKDKFPDCGCVSDEAGNVEYGYKVVFLYEMIDRKGMIVAMRIAPIQAHDINLGRELVSEFPFEKGRSPLERMSVVPIGRACRVPEKNGELAHVLFVTTKYKLSAKALLALYDHRAEIEEAHRQMKCFQGLEKLPSKKWTNIVFRLVIGVIGYNLFNLFLNSENCDTFEQYSMKTLRQRKPMEKNPLLIIYAGASFAVLSQLEFMSRILLLSKSVREKLALLFARLQPG